MDEMSPRLMVVDAVTSCTRCPLHEISSGPVAFKGPTPTAVCVVGEAPGEQEDLQGAPFVGPAGEMLSGHLISVGFDVEQVAFVNTVSCWPKATPEWEHIHACAVNKEAQLDLVNPTYVLAVGKVAVKAHDSRIEIKYGRGRPWQVDGRIWFATYHPAAALRNGLFERAMHEDLERFRELVDAGPKDWMRFGTDKCFACNNDLFWIEQSGLCFCEVHMPEEGQLHKKRLEEDLAGARARLAATNGR